MINADLLLSVSGLRVSYDSIKAVDDISFDVVRGEIVTLIGANGAGKSSILRAISGLIPYAGSITYAGKRFKKNCRRSDCRHGHRPRTGRPGHLRQSYRAGKSEACLLAAERQSQDRHRPGTRL